MTTDTDHLCRASDSPSSDSPSDAPSELSLDEIFHLLQTNRRRDVIDYLLAEEGPVKMGHLAEVIAAKEHETTVAQLTSTQRQRVYIPLYQTHLPKLDEKGVIDYNKPRGIVRPGDRLDLFQPYLEAANSSDGERSESDPDSLSARITSDYYGAAIGASASLLLASVGGLLIPDLPLVVLITTLIILATVVTTFSNFRSATELNDAVSTTLTYSEQNSR